MTPPSHPGGPAVALRDLPNGAFGRIVEMPVKDGCAERLEALGLRVGKVVGKVSGMPFHGPVTLQLDGRQIAIGWKISSSVLVVPLASSAGAARRHE
ncbi:MAG: ferrous iron transport protein [Synergistaceae bacterium]|nr:ferrous iron transport protein [Synergistaceae bacterium]